MLNVLTLQALLAIQYDIFSIKIISTYSIYLTVQVELLISILIVNKIETMYIFEKIKFSFIFFEESKLIIVFTVNHCWKINWNGTGLKKYICNKQLRFVYSCLDF
jgi:hypothetical protein